MCSCDKPGALDEAKRLFASTGIDICAGGAKDSGDQATTEGARHLGAAIGSSAFKTAFVENKVKVWVSSIQMLAEIATSEPHAAFAVFTHCLQAGGHS